MYRNKYTNYPKWLIRIKTRYTIWKILLAYITLYSHYSFHKIWFAKANMTSSQTRFVLFSIYLVQGTNKTTVYNFFLKWGLYLTLYTENESLQITILLSCLTMFICNTKPISIFKIYNMSQSHTHEVYAVKYCDETPQIVRLESPAHFGRIHKKRII